MGPKIERQEIIKTENKYRTVWPDLQTGLNKKKQNKNRQTKLNDLHVYIEEEQKTSWG